MAKSLKPQTFILPGDYEGIWSAYFIQVKFHNGNLSEDIKVDEGIRGVNCKCKVTVDNEGWLYAE